MEITCQKCGKTLAQDKKFCTSCGVKIQPAAYTCQCGNLLNTTLNFCTQCGLQNSFFIELPDPDFSGNHKLPDVSCSCGAKIHENVKFCVVCGKAVNLRLGQVLLPQIQNEQKNVNVDQQILIQPVHGKPKMKARKFLRIAMVTFVIGVIVTGAYFAYDNFFGGIRKKLLIEQKIIPGETNQTVSYKEEISVTVPYGLVDTEETMSLSSVKGLPSAGEGLEMLDAYDVSMTNVKQLDGFIEITISYNPSDIPEGMSADEALTCLYFNEATETWEPVPYIIDEAKHQMTIYTSHLSIFAPGVISEKVIPGPMMKILKVRFPAGDMMDDEKMKELLGMYGDNGSGPGGQGVIAGWDCVNEWFGLTSNASTFAENALEVGALKGCNEIALEVGLAFALVQAAIDFNSGKKDKAVLELTKNLGNYSVLKIFNTTAMNIAFVGVFAIDYSLNKFATTAISGRNKIYQDAYDLYYKEKITSEKINSVWWYKKLKGLARKAPNPSEAGDVVRKFMEDFVWEFWSSDVTVATYMERIMSTHTMTGGGGLSEQLKRDISNNHLASIINTLDKSSVFDRIMNELRLEAQGKLYDQLCIMQTKLNVEHPITVIIKKDPESDDYNDISLSGLSVMFITSNPAHKDLWKGTTDKNGEMQFRCTALGYVDAGCPTSVEVEVPSPVAGNPPDVFSGEMKLGSGGKVTIVEILIGAPKLEGTWKLDATCTFAKLDASLQYMDAMADMYGSGDEYRKERAKTTESMKGQKGQFPDLVMDGMEYIWKVTKEAGYTVISSPGFDDKKGLGGTQYRIKFNGRKQFSGTMETRSYLGDKENVMKFDVIGTRVK